MAEPKQKTMDEALQETIAAHETGQQAPAEEQEATEGADEHVGEEESAPTQEGAEAEEEAAEDAAKKPKSAQEKPAKEVKPRKDGPASWPADLREQFHTLPRRIKDVILKGQGDYVRREAEVSRQLNVAKQREESTKPIVEAIAPFLPHFEARGVTPAAALRNFLTTEYALRTEPEPRKAEIVANLMHAYGVTPAALVEALRAQHGVPKAENEAPPPKPTPQPHQGELRDPEFAAFKAALIRNAQAKREAEDSKDEAALHEFLDSGEAEFFDDVHQMMIRLSAAAQAAGERPTWKDLYETACYATPSVRSVLDKRRADEAALQHTRKAQQAKRAGSSVRTEPAAPQGARKKNLEDALREGIEAHYGRQE